MPGPILSSLDVPGPLDGYPPPNGPSGSMTGVGQMMAPPIIPDVTQLGPERMRSVMQETMAQPSPDDEMLEGEMGAESPPVDPKDIINQVGSLAYDAAKIPGLPDALIKIIRTVASVVAGPTMPMSGDGISAPSSGSLAPPRPIVSSPGMAGE